LILPVGKIAQVSWSPSRRNRLYHSAWHLPVETGGRALALELCILDMLASMSFPDPYYFAIFNLD